MILRPLEAQGSAKGIGGRERICLQYALQRTIIAVPGKKSKPNCMADMRLFSESDTSLMIYVDI